jgi:hypothetical protein
MLNAINVRVLGAELLTVHVHLDLDGRGAWPDSPPRPTATRTVATPA